MDTYNPVQGDIYEIENSFYLRSHPSRLAKLIAHYELYQKICSLPGALLELGVYKGASLVRFATFREMLENAFSRRIIGFDAFGSFPRAEVQGQADKAFIEKFEGNGGPGISKEDLERVLSAKGLRNVDLIRGNIFDTLPEFLTQNPAEKIALLHLDMDVYEPTAFALDQLLPRMVRGGIVLFDDYTMVEGATRAADEICQRHGLKMEKLSNYVIPAFFTAP